MGAEELVHDVVEFVEWTGGTLGFFGIAQSLVVPVLVEGHLLFLVGGKHFFLKSQVLQVELPVGQIVIGDVCLTVVLLPHLVDVALTVAPVVIF